MKKIVVLLVFLLPAIYAYNQHKEVPFTLADRDRIIKTEARIGSVEKEMASLRNEMNSLRNEMNSLRNEMNSLRNEMDAKFEAINAKIDYMYWVQGVIIALIIFMMGFIMWDRRTAMAPIREDVDKLKTENEKMKQVFRFLSDTQPQIREILKKTGIL